MEKRDDELNHEDAGTSRITDEKTQIAIRIPAELRDKFRIDPQEDGIKWDIIKDENGMSLHASLIKGLFKNEKENKKRKNK
jgi:hypothetical protein